MVKMVFLQRGGLILFEGLGGFYDRASRTLAFSVRNYARLVQDFWRGYCDCTVTVHPEHDLMREHYSASTEAT